MITAQPTIQAVWQWLEDVPDPEIPVVSVVELGIVRDVAYAGEKLNVTITPTYSGCPATAIIRQLIEQKLRAQGVDAFHVGQRLSPPWTTDWVSDTARDKIKAFGIAPPVDGTAPTGRPVSRAARLAGNSAPVIACPRCNATNTEKISQFGSTPCKASFRCRDCLEPFEYFKCI